MVVAVNHGTDFELFETGEIVAKSSKLSFIVRLVAQKFCVLPLSSLQLLQFRLHRVQFCRVLVTNLLRLSVTSTVTICSYKTQTHDINLFKGNRLSK